MPLSTSSSLTSRSQSRKSKDHPILNRETKLNHPPPRLDEIKSRKRIYLSLKLPSSTAPSAYTPTSPIFDYTLRLPDVLAATAHFRPEVRRKIASVRDEEQKKLRKASEEEKAEDRRLEAEKKKREIRDSRLKGMGAEEQRKFLEKEREKTGKKQEKRMSRKG